MGRGAYLPATRGHFLWPARRRKIISRPASDLWPPNSPLTAFGIEIALVLLQVWEACHVEDHTIRGERSCAQARGQACRALDRRVEVSLRRVLVYTREGLP